MKEEEAKQEAQKRIDKRSNIFCPLIKGTCKLNCECFIMPVIKNYSDMNRTDAYGVENGYCTAHCLVGES